ncbi:hypothetical protein [Streptomyces sp. 8K308]|uniref:hypothetical protein n=1 Tax=Streptomyces sp. 8K308 TaxID=2530388 RepID=UPI001FB7BB04|nr:hypothetical protein [Streptomyces sp. 8K308]
MPRQPSVLWWATQPRAPYAFRAVRAPATRSSSRSVNSGSQQSSRLAGAAGQ